MSARELVRQLVEYRKYKEAASELRRREEQASRVIFRKNVINILPEKTEELSEDIALLYKAFARVLRFVEQSSFNPEIEEQFSVEDKINYIEDLARREKRFSLEDVFKRCFNRTEVIATFLAVLELCRMKRIQIKQDSSFDQISVVGVEGQLEHGA